MKLLFLTEAIDEFAEAISYYSSIYKELGLDFELEIKKYINRILENPHLWPIREDDSRRVSLTRFPYYIVYIIEKDIIWVIAIAHHKRFPDYWKDRF